MAREETLVPSLTFAREVGDRKLAPLVGQREEKSFPPFSVIRGRKKEGFFLPLVSGELPEKQRKKERREKRGRKEEKERKLKGFSS